MFKKMLLAGVFALGVAHVHALPSDFSIPLPIGVARAAVFAGTTAMHYDVVHTVVDYLEKEGDISPRIATFIKSYDKVRCVAVLFLALIGISETISVTSLSDMIYYMWGVIEDNAIINTPLFEKMILDGRVLDVMIR